MEKSHMYIDKLYYHNVGPINRFSYQFRNNENESPVPLIIVGKNGSGKSILLSNIIDAFYEFATTAYENATIHKTNGKYQFYKEISPNQIQIGQDYMISHICMHQESKSFEYIFKSGDVSFDGFLEIYNNPIDANLNWGEESNFKKVTANEHDVADIFEKDIICFLGPNRYMKPYWIGKEYMSQD